MNAEISNVNSEPAAHGQEVVASRQLNSWKEIAAYLRRDVRTVRRWEKEEGLPVRRHLHKKQATVYAYVDELDEWWKQRKAELAHREDTPGLTRSYRWKTAIAISGVVVLVAIAAWYVLGRRVNRLPPRRVATPEALEAYQKGEYFWNKATEEGIERSVEYFREASERDPGYAKAYAALAAAYIDLFATGYLAQEEGLAKAKTAAQKALEIDHTLADAYVSLATIKTYEWDWGGAEQAYKHALQLDPRSTSCHLWYSQYLTWRGRREEARQQISEAEKLDPLGARIKAARFVYYYLGHEFNQAIKEAQKILELEPNSVAGHRALGRCYIQERRYDEGIAELERATKLSHGDLLPRLELAHAYAMAGRKPEASKILTEAQRRQAEKHEMFSLQAEVYIALGQDAEAFQCLEQAYSGREPRLTVLRCEPGFDPLRPDPRFQDLLRRVGLAP